MTEGKNMELDEYRYMHPIAKRAIEQLICDIEVGLAGHISVLIAASRVGKTTVVRELKARLESKGKRVVYIIAPRSGSGAFSWRPFQRQLLEELGYPFFRDIKDDDVDYAWRLIDDYLRQENIHYLIIDDADFLNDAKSANARNRVAGNLRTFAEASSARVIFTGTFRLQEMVKGESQILNRSDLAYMRPYRYTASKDDKREIDALNRCLENFNALLKIKLSKEVIDNPYELFGLCLGCVGALSESIRKAEGYAKLKKKAEVSYHFIRKAFKDFDPNDIRKSEIRNVEIQKNSFGDESEGQ
jgi:hypothetical protein